MLLAARYQLEELLGRGGMGEVWRARDEVLGRPVAVKLLLAGGIDPSAAARFRQEAQTTARLSHPNIVAMYDFGQADDRLYLVMEMVQGRSLADRLASAGALTPREVAAIGSQTASGLAAAHRQNVIHRDIKPANLLLAPDGTVKVVDFGIARLADDAAAGLTSAGMIVGSVSYLAPERALGKDAGPASDMYALGCVLYELLVGCPPFRADTPTALLYQHVQELPAPPRSMGVELPAELEQLVLALLAKEAEARPDAEQVADWLSAPGGLSTPATAQPTPLPSSRPAAAVGRTAVLSAPATRRSRRRDSRSRTVAISGLAAAALATAGYLLFQPDSAQVAAADSPATTQGATPSTTDPASSSPAASAASPPPSPFAASGVAVDTPAGLSNDPGVLFGQVSQELSTAAGEGRLDPHLADDLEHKVSQARDKLAEGREKGKDKTKDVRKRVRDIRHKLADAEKNQEFFSTPEFDRLLDHLASVVGETD
ncbi:serine/threonine-protein kinase [Streptomyces sp. CB01373]|uniref:serine/threonine-protein kinase n=1 Tax=Streptomyces sp. CB01373 TaxID=2020325 RepID=UPI000C27F0A5|nr:serine/threonine-protein kinase [Streptomyces sp. CB01373]PJM93863.1 serine/threonine protein kinase [Streptomyces sp. CB01373]